MVSILFSTSLYAASIDSADLNNQINQRITQEREQDLLQRNIEEDARIEESRKNRDISSDFQTKELKSKDKNQCIAIENISFKGNTIYSSRKLKNKFLKKYVTIDKTSKSTDNYSCITKENLNTVQSAITNYYIANGYANARVYFDISKLLDEKIIVIVIAEGVIKGVQLNNNSKLDKILPFRKKTKAFTAFPAVKNSPFNLRNFEQGLDQINRLASNNAKLESRPGEIEGYSDIVVNNTIKHPTQLNISYDNSGQETTGKHKKKASISQDNILGLNDNIYLNYTKDADGDTGDKFSKSFYGTASIPLGYWTFSGEMSRSTYMTTTYNLNSSYKNEGLTETEAVKIERMLFRGKKQKLKGSMRLETKETKSYNVGILSTASSRRLTPFTTNLNYIVYPSNDAKYFTGTLYSNFSHTRGLGAFNAKRDDHDILKTEEHAQYDKFNFDLSYSIPFWNKFTYKISSSGQYSKNVLYGSEKFAVGGQYTVRGFHENSIDGDNGYRIGNDIEVGFGNLFKIARKDTLFNKALHKTTLGVFFDYGYIRNKYIADIDKDGEGYMSGTGAKIRYSGGKYFNWDLTYSRGLHSPAFVENVYGHTPDEESIYFKLSFDLGA